MLISRRVLLASSAGLTAGCASRRRSAPLAIPHRGTRALPRVDVSPDRVIRVIAGLRPFRPSGFVLRTERLGDKTLVHNYGHGGAGITLSWGVAQLAADECGKAGERRAAVLGCGVIGLSTARILQQRGYAVDIYTKDMPPQTTSNVAGGLWAPVTVFEGDRVTADFRTRLNEAARISHRLFQSYAGDDYGVYWRTLFRLSMDRAYTPSTNSDSLYPETRVLGPKEHPFDVPHAMQQQTMVIEPAPYLRALVRDFFIAGGRIVVREFANPADVATLEQKLIVNCTGLGSRALFSDEELTPVRGQLVFLLPQPEIDYCTIGPAGIYMFPRRDGILLGGSHEPGNWDITPDAVTTRRIVAENGTLFRTMRG